MPIYEYQCNECGYIQEIMHKISETPEIQCPKCSGSMKKLISPSAFHLKGSGWYVTDYAKKSNNTNNKSTKEKSSTNSNKCCSSCKAQKVANG